MSWTLRVDVAAHDLAARRALADRLWEDLGATWVSEAAGVLRAGFADPALAAPAAYATGGEVVEVDDSDDTYLDTWRAFARPTRAGRVVVRPAWLAPIGADGTVEVAIDPGHAFGHGGHPSTRLVLELLSARLAGGETVLDVGCGSGVLGVVALRLGARSVLALDVEPVALEVTAANARANDVPGALEVSGRPLRSVTGVFDVVVANIGAVVLRDLAAALAARVAPGGWLALSGLLDEQWAEVATRVPGMRVEEVLHDEGWAAVLLVRATADDGRMRR